MTFKSQSDRSNCFDLDSWLTQGSLISWGGDTLLVGWGHLGWHTAPDRNLGENWFYFPDYFLRQRTPWAHFENTAIFSVHDLLSQLKKLSLDPPATFCWSLGTKQYFKNGFECLKRAFAESALEKAVPYLFARAEGEVSPSTLRGSLIKLLEYLQEAPVFAYGFWSNLEGILGATPELLFRSNSLACTAIETMALAGTAKSGIIPSEILLDEKLLHEHRLVVDDIIGRLGVFGRVKAEPLKILSLPMLSHLYTPISVETPFQWDFSAVIKALHPTPALGGSPRDLAHQWLLDYDELLPRGRFGAPVGYWDLRSNQMVCYVAIRNMMWTDREVRIGAGCGITAKSCWENEWREALLKVQSIKRFLFD